MFTGIVEERGRVLSFKPSADKRRLTIGVGQVPADLAIGDSVALDGCCLTVVESTSDSLAFDLLEESIRRTRFGDLTEGEIVNIEYAMRLGGKMGGHLVTGHIDVVGTVAAIERSAGGDTHLQISHDPAYARLLVEKGSIAMNGVSLTVADVQENGFGVWLIPHTLAVTNLGSLEVNTAINLEFDLIAKHVDKLTAAYRTAPH